MLKRFFALFILGFFITFKCLTWVPTAAVSGIPALDALEYSILQTIAMATQNGAEIDFTDSLADVIHDVNEGAYSVEYGLKTLLKEYASKVWDQITFDLNDPYNQDNLNFLISGISYASGNSISVLSDIIRQYDNKVLDNSSPIVTRFNESDTAFWNKYDTYYINEYLSRINYIDSDIDLPPSLTPYTSYITIGNTWNYFVTPTSYNDVGKKFLTQKYLDPNICLVFEPVNSQFYNANNLNINDYLQTDGVNIPGIFAYDLTTSNFYCFIDSDDHTITYPDVQFDYWQVDVYNNYVKCGCYRNIDNNYPVLAAYGIDESLTLSHQFNSTEDAFVWYSKYCVNVPLLYGTSLENAVYISAGGMNISGDFSATVPNGVIDTTSDDGKIVSNPIYWVVDENTGNPIDAQINLDKLADLLKGMIDGTRDDTNIGFNDLVDAGVIEKTDGTSITDENIGTRSIADVIDIAATKTGDVSITGEIAGIIPPLPILPKFTPGNTGDPTAGFRGMSVLARIVNVTNRGLPDDLIAMFYGIVACLIVLGLIKVLHK